MSLQGDRLGMVASAVEGEAAPNPLQPAPLVDGVHGATFDMRMAPP